jgi:hypothetical protein
MVMQPTADTAFRPATLYGPCSRSRDPQGRATASNVDHALAPAADRDAWIPAQLIRELAVAVPFHLPLVDGQNVPVPRRRDDVALSDFLFQMRTGDRCVLVIGIVLLSFQVGDGPVGHGRAERQRANNCTHYEPFHG